MEEQKKKKGKGIGIVIFLLILAILTCCGLGYYIYYISGIHEQEMAKAKNTITSLESDKNSLNAQIKQKEEQSKQTEKKEENKTEESKTIYVNTPEYNGILGRISKLFSDMHEAPLPDFDDVRTLKSEYLSWVASNNMKSIDRYGVASIYDLKLSRKDLNSILVKVYGERANGIIEDSGFEVGFPFALNEDGQTYHPNGYDGPEGSGVGFFIDSISQTGNKYKVRLLEYKYDVDWDIPVEDQRTESGERFYDLKGNLFLTIKDKFIFDNNNTIIDTKYYDKNDNEIQFKRNYIEDDDLNYMYCELPYLKEKYKDKLSVQELELEYDKNRFILLSAKTIK